MTRQKHLNALLILCSCVLLMYFIQDYALRASGRYDVRTPLSAFQLGELETEDDEISVPEIKSQAHNRTIWITMSVCWSSNTKYHGKENFPYTKAAVYSSKLWMKLTPAKVILQVVYSEDHVSKELLEYKRTLEDIGVHVILVSSEDMECVLKAQIIRILVFGLPFVDENDIVVTADVDAFIMTPKVTRPLTSFPHKRIWIYRYELSMALGYTFMMPFIGAVASTWRDILDYNEESGIPGMIRAYKKKMELKDSYTWDVDQHIVSHSILNSRLCTLPKNSKLWKELNIEYKDTNDASTCWHGSGIYEDCNNKLIVRNLMIRYQGSECKWWHFYPEEREPDLKAKFDEIVSGESGSGFFNKIIDMSKEIQRKAFGKIISI